MPLANSGVKFPPPTIFVAAAIIAWLLETRVTRIHIVGGAAASFSMEIFGAILLLAGFALISWGLYTFASAHTGILPMRPATTIVDFGPYRFTRNPMYTGMTIMYVGGALGLNWGWALILLPAVLIAVYALVIRREERYLISAFPTEYGDYKRRVRRWL
jgi:protein-S-isoprenylcysteine O-methyltransferase Ste14